MPQEYGPYHRLGEPGGPGCPVSVLPVSVSSADGGVESAQLLDAGTDSTELELLRTIASRSGVRWGHDDFGWWAMVRDIEFPTWAVYRQDDSGNTFLVEANITEDTANKIAADFEAKGHKQTYWVKNEELV